MKYLLDTMVWLWSVGSVENVGSAGQAILSDADVEIYLSTASTWEIAIKARIGKSTLPEPPSRYIPKRLAEQNIQALTINQSHALKVYDLPLHHRDPFDRLIIAQAMVEEMVILTSDRDFEKYPVQVVWCGK
jgi:PIN domain nuclease of toxin-antitoxin system